MWKERESVSATALQLHPREYLGRDNGAATGVT